MRHWPSDRASCNAKQPPFRAAIAHGTAKRCARGRERLAELTGDLARGEPAGGNSVGDERGGEGRAPLGKIEIEGGGQFAASLGGQNF